MAQKVRQFGQNRRAIAERIAQRHNQALPQEIAAFFDAVEGGDWEEIHTCWKELRTHTHQYEDSKDDRPDLEPYWATVLDTYGAAEQAHEWPAQKLLDYGNAILDSLRPDMVYVGGTDNGRWVPALLSETSANPHIVLTQNALADGTYLDYVRELYGDRFNSLSSEDSQQAFQEYTAEAQKRLQHDVDFPDEPKQVRPGENLKLSDGRVQISGMVAVMAINEKLLQQMMAKNPDLSFAVQESFPMRNTCAQALPLGPVMELGAQDAEHQFTNERAAQSVDYWRSITQSLLADLLFLRQRSEFQAKRIAICSVKSVDNFLPDEEIYIRMSIAHGPVESRKAPGLTGRGGRTRRWLIPAVLGLLLLGLFYTEENWRGKRTWAKCQRTLRTRGIALDWTNYLPAAVPEDQNIFGVPEMVRWFHGRIGIGWSDLARALPAATYPGLPLGTNTPRMSVAELVIGLPGTPKPDGFTALGWGDPAARTRAATLLNDALGPTARAPQSPIGIGLMLRRPATIQPARILLRCQSAPADKELKEFLPDSIVHANLGLAERVLQCEPDGDGAYRVTMPKLAVASDYLAWSDGLQAPLALIRRALKRPYSQLPGVYTNPNTVPGPNFQAVRTLSQTLGARAQCHLLLGQPEEALEDLTLLHEFCRRILAEQQPATFLSAMVNQAARKLYAAQIAEGLRRQAWREPQVATLQRQLETVNVLSPVAAAFTVQAAITFRALESVPSAGMVRRTALAAWYPRGWGYQHVAARVKLDFGRSTCFDSAKEIIFPEKVLADAKGVSALESGAYTFAPSLEQLDFARACQVAAHSQSLINQTLLACALERFRLAHGEYPGELAALVPEFLGAMPQDVIGGGPFHYRHTSEHTFVLYSVGWNRRDDGGMRGRPPGAEGDWVWPD